MKTQNNNQETSNSQVSKSTLGASAVLFGAVLISLSVNAQDLWKEFTNSASYGKMALVMDGQLSETEHADAAFKAINAEVASLLSSPIESEEAMEVESWMVAEEFFISKEAPESAEPSLEVESWMIEDAHFTSTVNFNAVESEESLHIEAWMTADAFFNSAEVLENAEPALKVESWMTEAGFFTEAEQYTANTADAEIAKYAERIVNAIEAEEPLAIESWMTTEEYFNSPEVLAHEEPLQVESWMLEAENFSNQPAYEKYAAK